jgi:hypothetical protein
MGDLLFATAVTATEQPAHHDPEQKADREGCDGVGHQDLQ